ncbi:MAG: alpha/beta fold hydrolase [Magnetovibrio sp.]|nr:alpha/beta fold hydrolase [Magnetovibrio sp.]
MTPQEEDIFDINENTYQWCVRSFQAIRKRLGLNVKVHSPDHLMKRGHIFLFNHFARFETIIPPFVIHRTTGAYCRTIADHVLFEGGENSSSFLRGVGAVPNNLPGLLPFLAAEILRGRKVVVFPEGGMVKDRRVLGPEGNFNVFSRTSKERRKHHRGAAVLALTLDIFKRRILVLHSRGDHARINRWVKALGLKDADELMNKAVEPTLIIPSTITFYPIRIQENFISRAADMFMRGLSQQFAEEMKIEGNLLLRDTDMDIRLGGPIEPQKKWRWWETFLMNRYFAKNVWSLNDLFGLKDQAESFTEKMLAKCISTESLRIRDEYMREMYAGITVNLSHLASHLIVTLIDKGQMEIRQDLFHRTLYLALKNLQATPGVHLHRSLLWPDRYRLLLEGVSIELERFLKTCKTAGLVGRTPGSYRFLDKLCDEHSFDEVRLENPVEVYANEVEPLSQVHETMAAALKNAETVTEAELGSLLFDDELRAHQWNHEYFNQPRFHEINDQETATKGGEPYLLLPKNRVRTGVLLVHGFLASPEELRAYGLKLSEMGYAVMGVRLAGHGTSPWDLKTREWSDWLRSLQRGYRILSAFTDQVVVVGFSTGGSLSLVFAADGAPKLCGVASVSAPLHFRNRKMAFVPLVHGLNKLASWLPNFEDIIPFRENTSEHPDINYRSIPVHALYQLRQLTEHLREQLEHVHTPTLIIQGDNDPVVNPASGSEIFDAIHHPEKSLHWIKADRHGIFHENIGDTQKIITTFIEQCDAEATVEREQAS